MPTRKNPYKSNQVDLEASLSPPPGNQFFGTTFPANEKKFKMKHSEVYYDTHEQQYSVKREHLEQTKFTDICSK